MRIYQVQGNGLAGKFKVFALTSGDGVSQLRCLLLRSAKGRNSKGTVIVLQGRGEMMEKYFEIINEWRQRGYAVATFDWHSQGMSGGGQLCLNNYFAICVNDLLAFKRKLSEFGCPEPFYGFAHSMGGCIMLLALLKQPTLVDKAILCAPMIELNTSPLIQNLLWPLLKLAAIAGLGQLVIISSKAIMAGLCQFEGNQLTHDLKRYQRNMRIISALPRQADFKVTLAWLADALRVMWRLRGRKNFGVPILALAAGQDQVVSTRSIAKMAERSNSLFVLLSGSRHEIMQETDLIRGQAWAAIDSFLAERK